jgi:hypothetical protein
MDEINVEVSYVIESSYMVNADVDGTSVQKELEFDVASYEQNILNLYLERSVLLMEESGEPGENHCPVASH